MTQSSCKRDTESKSHRGMKLAPVRVSHVNTPLLSKSFVYILIDSGLGIF